MKKLIPILFLTTFFITSSCHTNTVSKVGSGVKVVAKCRAAISDLRSKTFCSNGDAETKPEKRDNDTLLLPVNSWDTKMMIF